VQVGAAPAALDVGGDVALQAVSLTIEAGGRTLVRELSFALPCGRMLCILGENGAGKTLTLHALAGQRAPAAGHVRLAGRGLADWTRRERARRLGLLPQATEDPFPVTVLDAVLVGRHPHLDFFAWEGPADLAVARASLAACDLAGFESRGVDTLSGGERRRVALAAVLAQDPDVLLLDEPQNHLDPHHQRDVLELLRARVGGGSRRTVIATLHDPTLALRYADDVLLLYGDGRWRYGTPAEVLSAPTLSELYRMPMGEIEAAGRRVFYAL
jgi:iron complex transport system ATP-binding protein